MTFVHKKRASRLIVGRGDCRHDEGFVIGDGRKYVVETVEVEPCSFGFAADVMIEARRFEPKTRSNGFRGRLHGEGIVSPDGRTMASDPQQPSFLSK